MVGADGRVGCQVLASRTTKAIVFPLVNQLRLQVLTVSNTAAPERNVRGNCLLLQRANNCCRAIAAIGEAREARLTRSVFADNRNPGEYRAGHPTAP